MKALRELVETLELVLEKGLTLVERFYDEESTKPMESGYVDSNGNRTGEWTWWHENGTLRSVNQWNNGTKMETSK